MPLCYILHDVIEDVDFITFEYIKEHFSYEIAIIVDNVSKREGESYEKYIERVSSHPKSALVKTLDRVNNISSMGHSSLKHRQKQLKETNEVFIPLMNYLTYFLTKKYKVFRCFDKII